MGNGGDGHSPGDVRERVYRYRVLERDILGRLGPDARVLDLGCSEGANSRRLQVGGATVVGVDVSLARLRRAVEICPVAAAAGERLPFAGGAFGLVYVSHVLHHARDHLTVLREIRRVLAPGGVLMVIETFEDNPLMRIAREVRPEWDGDRVRSRFRFSHLVGQIRSVGLEVRAARQFNVVYWAWEVAQSRIRALAGLLELTLRTEELVSRRLARFGAHGYIVARAPDGVSGAATETVAVD